MKKWDITLQTNVCIVTAMVFPAVMYSCESWTVKKTECQKSWCLWTAVLEKTPESPLVCKEIKPSILREINSEYSLKGLIVRLKLQYFGHLIWTASSLDGFPDAGKDWGQEKRLSEDEMVGWHHLWKRHNLDKLQEMMRDREVWCATV